jgi:IS5 family transposase
VTEGKVFRRVSKNGTRQDEGVTTDVVWYAVKRYAIHAPSSTKNSTGTRDPEMHQTRKGNQWYFGMKAATEPIRGRARRSARLPRAQDMTSRRTRYKQIVDELQRRKNRTKARVRAKVEHPFRILKRVFGFVKVRFRGLKKNHDHLCAAFALVNLYQHRKQLASLGA